MQLPTGITIFQGTARKKRRKNYFRCIKRKDEGVKQIFLELIAQKMKISLVNVNKSKGNCP